MKKRYFFMVLLVVAVGCSVKERGDNNLNETERQRMLEADRAFSSMSEEKGMKAAFMEYIDSNGVLLRPSHFPIQGADAIDFLSQSDDKGYSYTWTPKDGFIAKSGEMGYTYGVYSLKPKDKDTLINGTYVSIWKKQADGNWKFVLDSGNEGLGDLH